MNNGITKTVAEWAEEGKTTGRFVSHKGSVVTYHDIGGCTGNGRVRAMGVSKNDALGRIRTYYLKWSDRLTLLEGAS
jgi:hypothetical protein